MRGRPRERLGWTISPRLKSPSGPHGVESASRPALHTLLGWLSTEVARPEPPADANAWPGSSTTSPTSDGPRSKPLGVGAPTAEQRTSRCSATAYSHSPARCPVDCKCVSTPVVSGRHTLEAEWLGAGPGCWGQEVRSLRQPYHDPPRPSEVTVPSGPSNIGTLIRHVGVRFPLLV